MRFVNRSWLLLAAGALSGAALAACSADAGSGSGVGDDSGTADGSSTDDASTNHDAGAHDSTTTTDSSAHMDSTTADTSTADTSTADTSSADTSTADTSTSDTGTTDATSDAMGDSGLPPTGSACSPQNSTQQQSCGLCGVQNRVCLAPDGGTPVWQQWGFCQNEVANGCVPASQTTEACGLCGTRQKVCQIDCRYAVGACTGQPPNACAPGSTDYEPGLSCDAGGRTRTCGTNCTFGNFGNCSTPEGGTGGVGLTIGGVGATVFGTFNMPASPKLAKVNTGSCATTLSTSLTTYSYVAVYNPTSSAHTVSIWNSRAPGSSTDIDTIMTAYNSMTAPVTAAERQACMPYVNDDCSNAPCPNNVWAGLVVGGDGPVTIPANSNVVIYTAAWFSSSAGGDYQLNARTEN